MINGLNGEKYDFKDLGKGDLPIEELNKYRHRGMQLKVDEDGNKVFGSARDVGNYAAGYAASKNGLYWNEARLGFDFLQSVKARKPCTEGKATQSAQRLGFNAGENSSRRKDALQYRYSTLFSTYANQIVNLISFNINGEYSMMREK